MEFALKDQAQNKKFYKWPIEIKRWRGLTKIKKKKENKKKIKRWNKLEEREIHLSKRENVEKINGWVFTENVFFFSRYFRQSLCLPYLVFLFIM